MSRVAVVIAGGWLLACAGAAADSGTAGLLEAARTADVAAALAALAADADANATESDGTTALHWAAHHDAVELVDALLAAGADPAAVNEYGATPMSEAAVVANPELLRRLLDAGAAVDAPNGEGQTALMVVARTSNVAAAELLLARGADVNARELRKGQTALMWAAAQSRPDMVEVLIEHGADVDARSMTQQWQRNVTAEPRTKNLPVGGFTPLLFAARQGCVECARQLVDAGADIDLPNPDAITPLLMALLNAHFDTAAFLIERGANVNKWDWWGRTPLYAAVDYNTVPFGGRPDRPSPDRTTSLDMISILLDAGANPNAQLKLFPPYRSLRMDRGADGILDIGTTALLRAAKAADSDAIELLLTRGALVDLPQRDGITPLMAAAGIYARGVDTRGRFTTEPEAIEAARRLLQAGARVDAADRQGRTALHAAAARGWTDLARLLVEHGADPLGEDRDGVTSIGAAEGGLAGRGRGGAAAYPETAEALRAMVAAVP